MEDEEYRNWAELPPELTLSILKRLYPIDILASAEKVCRTWRRICKDPSMWRVIDMHNPNLAFRASMKYKRVDDYFQAVDPKIISMCYKAVNRSQGGLVEINILHYGSDDLLKFIADRSSNLKSLTLSCCTQITDQGFVSAVVKLPLLEYLELSDCLFSGESLNILGQSCPNIKTLKVNRRAQKENDNIAFAIAETMPRLHYLQLWGNGLSDIGLKSILDNCPNLEHLDIRLCFNVNRQGDTMKRCFEKIKVVIRPNDSADGMIAHLTLQDYSEDGHVFRYSDFFDEFESDVSDDGSDDSLDGSDDFQDGLESLDDFHDGSDGSHDESDDFHDGFDDFHDVPDDIHGGFDNF